MNQHLTKDPEPPSARVAGIPATLDALVLSLLSKDPAGRPASVGQVLADLTEIQNPRSPLSDSQPANETAAGAASGQGGAPTTTVKAGQPGERRVASRPAVPVGTPIAGATWTASGPEVFALCDGRIWFTQRPDGVEGAWATWAELPGKHAIKKTRANVHATAGSPSTTLSTTQTRRSEASTTGELKIISGRFNANAAWLAIAAIAHNLVRAAGALAGRRHAKARAATIRRDLITIAARAARHGRGCLALHLPECWHREREWLDLWEAASGPPAQAA